MRNTSAANEFFSLRLLPLFLMESFSSWLLSVSDGFLLASSLSIPTSHPLRMCVPECPPGFFRDDKRRCKKCSPLCESCIGSRSDQCTSCRQGFYLREGANTCIYACHEGYYLDRGKLTLPCLMLQVWHHPRLVSRISCMTFSFFSKLV